MRPALIAQTAAGVAARWRQCHPSAIAMSASGTSDPRLSRVQPCRHQGTRGERRDGGGREDAEVHHALGPRVRRGAHNVVVSRVVAPV